MAFDPVSFFVQIVLSYASNKLSAPDGPRLEDLNATKGDYGVPIPRLFGQGVRTGGIIIAMPPIKETKRKVKKNWLDRAMNIVSPITNLLPQPNYYTYSATLGLLLADRRNDEPIEDVTKVWCNGQLVFDRAALSPSSESLDGDGGLIKRTWLKGNGGTLFASLTIYGGGFDQTIDPALSAVVEDVPGFRGSAYVVFEDLELADFGNGLPQIECLVVAKDGQTLADVAETVCSAAGINAAHNLSTSGIASLPIRGYAVASPVSCWEAIADILPAHAADVAEVSGQIRFFQRGAAMRYIIPDREMAGHEFGTDRPEAGRARREPDRGLPQETSVTFRDPDRDYQTNTQSSRRTQGDARSNIAEDFALTLTADEGRTMAELLHWEPWAARHGRTFATTDRFDFAEPGDVIGLEAPSGIRPHRITRTTRGANGVVEFETVADESIVYRSGATGSSGIINPNEAVTSLDSRLVLIDGPILGDIHDDTGFYYAVASEGTWRGASVERAETTLYEAVGDYLTLEAVIGDMLAILPAGPTTGLDDTLDTTSEIRVELLGGTLESVTDDELDALYNLAWVGTAGVGEVLQFKTATLEADGSWTLTNLRRGRKGTDWRMAGHVADETFVLLEPDTIHRADYGSTDWTLSQDYRAVSEGQEDADADVLAFTNTGEGKRPYSPVNVLGSRDGSNNLTLTWDRRSRLNDGTLGEDTEEYEVDVIVGGSPVRTISVIAETAIYPAADQTSDGITPGNPVTVDVYQISAVRGRGRPRRTTV